MQMLRRVVTAVLSLGMVAASSPALHADSYNGNPKLVIMLVFDQFRGDYLDRYRADFHAKNGWNLFLKQGAHYTDCYYDYANLITAAGHSTIGTGAYTDGHGIGLNEWWEPGPDGKQHQVSSVEDPRYTIVGAPAGTPVSPGASPKNETASTVGDELVLATQGRARVYGISFKDRAAILTSGHTQKAAFWTDHDSGDFVTSTYWLQTMPAWVTAFNNGKRQAQARKEGGIPSGSFYEKLGRTPASVSYQLDFAKALIQNEHLGANPAGVTDLLTLSISSTDILGHAFGPDSPEERAMIDTADVQLDSFFSWLDSTVGLQNVMVTFTGDHGVAPTIQTAQSYGLPARSLKPADLQNAIETSLQQKFKPTGNVKYVLGYDQPWIQIDPAPFVAQGISEADAENATRDAMEQYLAVQAKQEAATPPTGKREPDAIRAQFISTISQMKAGLLPDTDYGRREMRSYTPRMGWGVHFNLGAYQYGGYATGATHYSANSYDRHVPLDMFGAGIRPGTYHGVVAPVDIAATLASLLRTNRPSAAVGRVLTEAMKPDAGQ